MEEENREIAEFIKNNPFPGSNTSRESLINVAREIPTGLQSTFLVPRTLSGLGLQCIVVPCTFYLVPCCCCGCCCCCCCCCFAVGEVKPEQQAAKPEQQAALSAAVHQQPLQQQQQQQQHQQQLHSLQLREQCYDAFF